MCCLSPPVAHLRTSHTCRANYCVELILATVQTQLGTKTAWLIFGVRDAFIAAWKKKTEVSFFFGFVTRSFNFAQLPLTKNRTACIPANTPTSDCVHLDAVYSRLSTRGVDRLSRTHKQIQTPIQIHPACTQTYDGTVLLYVTRFCAIPLSVSVLYPTPWPLLSQNGTYNSAVLIHVTRRRLLLWNPPFLGHHQVEPVVFGASAYSLPAYHAPLPTSPRRFHDLLVRPAGKSSRNQ